MGLVLKRRTALMVISASASFRSGPALTPRLGTVRRAQDSPGRLHAQPRPAQSRNQSGLSLLTGVEVEPGGVTHQSLGEPGECVAARIRVKSLQGGVDLDVGEQAPDAVGHAGGFAGEVVVEADEDF